MKESLVARPETAIDLTRAGLSDGRRRTMWEPVSPSLRLSVPGGWQVHSDMGSFVGTAHPDLFVHGSGRNSTTPRIKARAVPLSSLGLSPTCFPGSDTYHVLVSEQPETRTIQPDSSRVDDLWARRPEQLPGTITVSVGFLLKDQQVFVDRAGRWLTQLPPPKRIYMDANSGEKTTREVGPYQLTFERSKDTLCEVLVHLSSERHRYRSPRHLVLTHHDGAWVSASSPTWVSLSRDYSGDRSNLKRN